MAGADRTWRRNLSSVILGQPNGLNPANIQPGTMPLLRKKNLRSAAVSNFSEPIPYLLIAPRPLRQASDQYVKWKNIFFLRFV